ncbi:PDDEXK nuclease domain-containing protein [Deinococcus rubellus]|uniref:PDDEXK nuclease domain-containing protein n=1 Tax=Deinococcus rubellus TaxID=1889240 RepID=UPI0031EE31C6
MTQSDRAADEADFAPVLTLIRQAQSRALHSVNRELIELYWQIGEHLQHKTEADGWGRGTVTALAAWIAQQQPDSRGFSASNLWRMRQFYETYRQHPKLAPLVRELSWTNNLTIMGRAGSEQEREFYLQAAIRGRWTKRELERQMDGSLYERALLSPAQLSPVLQEQQPAAPGIFKDSYLLDFLNLPQPHSEQDLQRGLVSHLKDFLLELGPDFSFMGEEYRLQVGQQDFFIDLLMYHRRLQALVAFELKITAFSPSMMGQLDFYLEALDRDHRLAHENPSIGVLLCHSADTQVVEYALARSASPALVARYLTELPDKTLLEAKLSEFYALEEGDKPDDH